MRWKPVSVGTLTVGPIPAAFLVEPYIPLGHWLWGVILLACVLPSAVTYGVPYIKRRLSPKSFRVPRLLQWRRPTQNTSTALASFAEDLVRFRECLPQVELCQKLVGTYASPLNMGIMQLLTGDITMIKLIRELEYLTRSLNALGIRCPTVRGGNDESHSDFRVRLRIWNMHLAELVMMIPHDDLVRARQLEPLNPTKPPTSGKSDALC